MPELVPPSEAYRESYCEALRESQDEWGHMDCDAVQIPAHESITGHVPRTTWWLVDGDEFIGVGWLRHVDADHLLDVGGHVGYEIRPSKRGLGYGKLILKLMLDKAREAGYESVVLLCNEDNPASRRIIEVNGGTIAGERTVNRRDGVIRHFVYVIELG